MEGGPDKNDQEQSDGLAAEYEPFDNWEDNLQNIARKLKENDMLVLIGALRGTSSRTCRNTPPTDIVIPEKQLSGDLSRTRGLTP
ncbi:MAG TPA: hypothetical protein VFX43_15480 [Chitinophagaceae bacterium]|nr:hypothetical protein [Chitinophagaceae bacterium]